MTPMSVPQRYPGRTPFRRDARSSRDCVSDSRSPTRLIDEVLVRQSRRCHPTPFQPDVLILCEMSSACWLALNSMMRKSARP